MTTKLDPLKHGDIAVLHVNNHDLLFLAGELFGVHYKETGVLRLSDRVGEAEPRDWYDFAVGEAFPVLGSIETIAHDELDRILHVKSLRTLRHEAQQHGT